MNKHKEMICGSCGEVKRRKYLGKINGVSMCSRCRKELRKIHRKQTIKEFGIKNKQIGKIKNAKKIKTRKKSYSLTLNEKQELFRLLVKSRGMDKEDAKERIQTLVDYQTKLSKKLSGKNKSEEEIRIKQEEYKSKMLEELWSS